MRTMQFSIVVADSNIISEPNTFYLWPSNWDDLFRFQTTYHLEYVDENLKEHPIGSVKIGEFGMGSGVGKDEAPSSTNFRSPRIPPRFHQLDDSLFSVGQDEKYYQNLILLGAEVRVSLLSSLRDIAFLELVEEVENETVVQRSLLRYLTRETVTGQFQRMATGGARLTKYRFEYFTKSRSKKQGTGLEFRVFPESTPPTNIHVIIGRNGVGKTRFLDSMGRALVVDDHEDSTVEFFSGDSADTSEFSKVVSISFSAFDSMEPIKSSTGKEYVYVGLKTLKRPIEKSGKTIISSKTPATLTREFTDSVLACLSSPERLARWRDALKRLEADPVFAEFEVASLADEASELVRTDVAQQDLRDLAISMYAELSSGHKIVLLTITRLVELVEEKSLVLLDEPESHLHPPLLSAFVRALSDLLIDRNGVAIIATHSPVVLQEVPLECAWIMHRSTSSRSATRATRPTVQTFGENVSVLTHEVFGLEVTKSGFHKLLEDAVAHGATYDSIVESYSQSLGGEARSILRGLIATRDRRLLG